MYLFCNSRIHVITLDSGHVCVYYASMLRCWHIVWILVRTDHPCLGVGRHRPSQHHLHVDASGGTLASRVVMLCRSRARRRRRCLTHSTVDLCSLFMWKFDVMTILCHDSKLFLCTFVVTNLAHSRLLMFCTFLPTTGAMNLCVEVDHL
jgi:hypothetical protein